MSNFNKEMHIVRWVERTRRLHKLFAIPPSCDVAFVRSERKLHYDFAKLKVRSRLLKLVYYDPHIDAPHAISHPSN